MTVNHLYNGQPTLCQQWDYVVCYMGMHHNYMGFLILLSFKNREPCVHLNTTDIQAFIIKIHFSHIQNVQLNSTVIDCSFIKTCIYSSITVVCSKPVKLQLFLYIMASLCLYQRTDHDRVCRLIWCCKPKCNTVCLMNV